MLIIIKKKDGNEKDGKNNDNNNKDNNNNKDISYKVNSISDNLNSDINEIFYPIVRSFKNINLIMLK